MASLSLSAQEREAIDRFRRDVLEASLSGVVVVRFTAEWCGPCKQLAPVIDRAIAATGDPRISQVVIDIDQNRLIAEQFRIQSVPTVYGFVGGRPVDGFVGAQPEREIRAFLEKLLQALGPDAATEDLESMIEEANQALNAGESEAAARAFAELARAFPERADVIGGYARALVALGELDGARGALATLPKGADHPAVQQARAALELADGAADPADVAAFRQRLATNPDDHDTRFQLASAELARGGRNEAAEHLLHILAVDREWEGGKARETLLKLIESVGLGDPWSVETRRRLRHILFA